MLPYVLKQPHSFEKFAYNSAVRKKTTLMSEFILLLDTVHPEIWIVADLYSHTSPPLLSPHVLRKNNARDDRFIIDPMQQCDPNVSYYNYILNNCHIRKTSNARQKSEIIRKLQYLKSWQTEQPVSDKDMDVIENTLETDYFNVNCGEKVYIGFTAYVRNPATGCKQQISDTIFSNAIYDIPDLFALSPYFGPISGGSKHTIRLIANSVITPLQQIQIRMTDLVGNSWQALTEGNLENQNIHFIAPPYTGNLNTCDGNRLINLEVIVAGSTIGAMKFVYLDTN